jgi:hypothetical protein
MKEFSVGLGSVLAGGLRPDDRTSINANFLTQLQNIRIVQVGGELSLATFVPIAPAFSTGYLAALSPAVVVEHPYPQLFKGRGETLMCTENNVYLVAESAHWDAAVYTTVDGYDVATAKSITSGGSWHFADFGTAWALFNGACVVFKTAMGTMFGAGSDVRVIDDLTISTGCSFRGRMIMGGFGGSGMWSSKWESFMKEMFDNSFGISFPSAPGTNYVWWSQIGDGAFFLLYPDLYTEGILAGRKETEYTTGGSILYDIIERNEMGFMPMHWQGTVLCTKPLGNGIMVYGTNGISYMPKQDNTFGLIDILPVGVAGRSAVAGNEQGHLFIDEAGWLWSISANLERNRLGYREFFEPMLGTDITGHYNPIEMETHFSNNDSCYIVSGNRLYESTYLTTGIAVSLGADIGLYDRPASSDKNYAILSTDFMDFGIRSVKTIERIVVSTVNSADVEVAVQWRNKSSDSFTTTTYTKLNHEGVAYFPITALEFKIIVRCTDYTKVDFDDVTIQFKVVDKRIVRGTYALEYRKGIQQ